jgi:signal transduction histidine kinase
MTRRADILGRGLFDVFPDNPDDPAASGVSNLRASLNRVLQLAKPDTMAVQKYDVRRPAAEGGGFEARFWSPLNAPVLGPDGAVAWIIHQVEDVTEFIRLKQQGDEQQRETEDLRQRAGRMETEVYRRAQELQETNRALRESEDQLRRLNETLEQRILERTQQLETETREHARAQEALREAQKLEAIGRLTGGIAHDFNNLLAVILGNSEILQSRLAPGASDRVADTIGRAAERGARLTRQLLAFSRRQALRPEPVDLRRRADDLADLLTRSLRGDIRVVVSFADDLWPIECDVGELELALLNICVNARDAMPGGGLLRIDARNVIFEAEGKRTVDLVGDFVSLIVSDTGTGIAPEILARVFEPFFTTKEVGKGTGLGLSQVYGFAVQAGGVATIASEPGRGTAVTLYVPRSNSAIAGAAEEPHAATARGTGVILLVEDDEALAEIAGEVLALIGYQSYLVRDARTALAILLGGRKFDLVFSDIVMPGGMSGLELARKVRQHFPGLPILLASGYSQATAEVAKEGFPIIAKPYRADALADAIRQSIRHTGRGRLSSA